VNGARVRRTSAINAALIRPTFFPTVWPAPTAESELMLYPCTMSAVNSSFDRDNPHPTSIFLDDARWPCAAVAGCRWLRMRDVVTRSGDGDGRGVGEGEGAAKARRRRASSSSNLWYARWRRSTFPVDKRIRCSLQHVLPSPCFATAYKSTLMACKSIFLQNPAVVCEWGRRKIRSTFGTMLATWWSRRP
jgi:hypothetical protein